MKHFKLIFMKYLTPVLFLIMISLISGCAEMTGFSRSKARRGIGYDALDLTIGALPVWNSLNPDQNKYPGLTGTLYNYHFYKSIEPMAACSNKKLDLLLICGPPGFSPEIKVLSGILEKSCSRRKLLPFPVQAACPPQPVKFKWPLLSAVLYTRNLGLNGKYINGIPVYPRQLENPLFLQRDLQILATHYLTILRKFCKTRI